MRTDLPRAPSEVVAELWTWTADQPHAPVRALEAAARQAARDPGRRAQLARLLDELIAGDASPDAKDAALRQLPLVGDATSLSAVAPLLGDERLGPLAATALLAMPWREESEQTRLAEAVEPALRAAVHRDDAARLAELCTLLARHGGERGVALLAALAGGEGLTARGAAIDALGACADPAAAAALLSLAPEDVDASDAPRLHEALLRASETRLALGDPEAARALLDRAGALPAGEAAQLAAAAARLAGADVDELPAARALLDDPRPLWWRTGVAVIRSERNPALTRLAIEALATLEGPRQAALLEAIGARRDQEARPALAKAALEGDPVVRAAACRALGALGGAESVPPLVEALNASEPGVAESAEQALSALRGPGVDTAIGSQLQRPAAGDDASPAWTASSAAPALLRILCRRQASEATPMILTLARGADLALAGQAVSALGELAREQDLPALVQLVLSPRHLNSPGVEVQALLSASRRLDDPARRTRAIIEAVDAPAGDEAEAGPRARLLLILGELGGDEALACVSRSLKRPGLADAAIAALGRWPDASAAGLLVDQVRLQSHPARRAAAFKGWVRALTLDVRAASAGARVDSLREAMARAVDDEERRSVVAAAGSLSDRAALPFLLEAAETPALRDAAHAAILACARKLPPQQRRDALAALTTLAEQAEEGSDLRAAVGRAADEVERDLDFVLAWEVAGPYERPELSLAALLDEPFPPELEGEEERGADGAHDALARDAASVWREFVHVDPSRHGMLDLRAALGGDNRVAYLRTRLFSPDERRVRLELGTDDGVKAWVNGELVHVNNVARGMRAGEDVVEASLRPGWNTLLLKVSQGGGDWSACCRVRAPDGFPSRGLVAMSDPRRAEAPPGAIVLVGGEQGLAAWRHGDGADARWQVSAEAVTVQPGTGDIVTRTTFEDCLLHVEFLCPPRPPEVAGQARSNSGVFLQGRYEVQVLDSFGEPPSIDGAASIYGRAAPRLNAARRPGEWQDLLVDFTAPRWDTSDPAHPRKTANARMTVWLNGVRIHDDVEVEGPTNVGVAESPVPGPLRLQDHGDPVMFRNVWIAP